MDAVEETLVERAWSNLARGFRDIASSAARTLGLASEEVLPDRAALKAAMQSCLEARGGDVAARLRAAELGAAYSQADGEGRSLFLRTLAEDFAADREAIAAAIAAWQEAGDDQRGLCEDRLRQALQAPRIRLITQFLSLAEGVKFLVDLRADLLEIAGKDPALRDLDRDLRSLLESWFDVGFLDVRLITWNSPASLLEKIVLHEAVHEIRNWIDLRNRLESDRRLYGLFHPRMPDEPLAFVEVALTKGLADSVQELLDSSAPAADPEAADTAIFYSISATQKGLAGIAFGEWLIKKVVQRLSHELPRLRTFATLSPIPGFAAWLARQDAEQLLQMTSEAEREKVYALSGEGEDFAKLLAVPLARRRWWKDETLDQALRPVLVKLCLRYLLERREDGQPLDAVARFHLRNGARLERINWLADVSANGMKTAHGLMVNYLYDPAAIDANYEAYHRESRVALGSDLRGQAKQLGAEAGATKDGRRTKGRARS